MTLRSLIYGKFQSESDFARALGWNRQRVNYITTGRKEPDLYEVRDMANALEIPFMTLAEIFLAKKSPNG